MKDDRCSLAIELKEIFEIISPYIERHTSLVCPTCEDVCCIDKHGHYDNDDLIFLKALAVEAYQEDDVRKETEPCRFLTSKGCSLERWRRPFRCTSFFCDPLIKSLQADDPKLYRAFVDYFNHLISIRQKLALLSP